MSVLSEEDRTAIEARHRAWLDAELRGDSSALLQFCTDTPVWLPPNEAPLCGKAEILRWLAAEPRVAILQIDIDDLEIAGVGPLALKLANFRTTFDGPGPGGAGVVTGSHAWLLQRSDAGEWLVSVVAWSLRP